MVPKVFISYSHDTEEHKRRVLDLANRLRREGIDCSLDRYEPFPSEGWPRWTERQIKWADYVLIVCTETYKRRVEGDEEPGRGLGATWEGRLITQAMYEQGAAIRSSSRLSSMPVM
ncbi:toll/interleukin-1 receptor domain-containing protein [Symbiobacterium terraclitae]|uniref:toll/interleukin-1 receptor domain-containing protein n=1 Tax=Symbiobacterium terraclitae TaxID=557451 RepID=UPI0035B567CE